VFLFGRTKYLISQFLFTTIDLSNFHSPKSEQNQDEAHVQYNPLSHFLLALGRLYSSSSYWRQSHAQALRRHKPGPAKRCRQVHNGLCHVHQANCKDL